MERWGDSVYHAGDWFLSVSILERASYCSIFFGIVLGIINVTQLNRFVFLCNIFTVLFKTKLYLKQYSQWIFCCLIHGFLSK